MTELVTNVLAWLTVVGDVLLGAGLILIGARKQKWARRWLDLLSRNGIVLGYVVALVATLGSLFFSEVAGFAPCKLCWYQRILMYPQVIILGVALIKKDRGVADYVLPLSGLGAGIAAYHYFLQRFPEAVAPCTTVGYAVSCAEKFVLRMGYITIPVMSLTAFLLIAGAMVVMKMKKK